MERPISTQPGASIASLDTPALVVDLDAFEANVNLVHGFFLESPISFRPSVHTHKIPALAHRQLAMSKAASGIAVISISEAEVFAASGITDIRITMQIPTVSKLRRVAALAKSCKISLVVDDPRIADNYSKAAIAEDVNIDVLVDVNVHPGRSGCPSAESALDLANLIRGLPGLSFCGLFTNGGPLGNMLTEDLIGRDRKALDLFIETKKYIEDEGLQIKETSFGNSTHDYALVGSTLGITEVRSGAYAFLDTNHAKHCPDLNHAAYVIATVNNRPESARAVTDCGQKAIGRDLGPPAVFGLQNLIAAAGSAEHGLIDTADGSYLDLTIGDRVDLIPADVSTLFSLHDIAYGVRSDIVESVWTISARGAFS